MKLATYILGTASGMLAIIGMLFKIQHWPGAGVMLTLGLAVFGIGFIPLFAIYQYSPILMRKTILLFYAAF